MKNPAQGLTHVYRAYKDKRGPSMESGHLSLTPKPWVAFSCVWLHPLLRGKDSHQPAGPLGLGSWGSYSICVAQRGREFLAMCIPQLFLKVRQPAFRMARATSSSQDLRVRVAVPFPVLIITFFPINDYNGSDQSTLGLPVHLDIFPPMFIFWL